MRATGHVDELEAEEKLERLHNNNIVAQRCWPGSLVASAWLEVTEASIRPADILSAEGESVCKACAKVLKVGTCSVMVESGIPPLLLKEIKWHKRFHQTKDARLPNSVSWIHTNSIVLFILEVQGGDPVSSTWK